MLFKQAQDKLALEVTKASSDSETLIRIKNSLNFGKSEVSKYTHWRHLEVPNNELLVIPQYTTGTASAVQDSRTVTLIGGTVSANFKGRFFKGQQSSQIYEITDVSVPLNTLTLKTPIIEASQTYAYTIWKRFYRVPSDIRIVLPNEDYADLPTPFEIHGYDDYAADYSVSVAFVEKSNLITGSGFFDNVFPGDMIIQDVNIYRVLKVNSDTQITMTNQATTTITQTATFTSDTPYKAQLPENPLINRYGTILDASGKTILPYSYIRTLYDMVADGDDTELPAYFDRAILDFAKGEYLRATNSPNWGSEIQLGQARLQKLELDGKLVRKSNERFKSNIPAGMGRGRYPGSSGSSF